MFIVYVICIYRASIISTEFCCFAPLGLAAAIIAVGNESKLLMDAQRACIVCDYKRNIITDISVYKYCNKFIQYL